jgi:predicted dehydrogenase
LALANPDSQLKRELESGKIGTPFRARIDMISGFPLFENQPFLKDLEQYILTDLGSHILDVARFLFGEAQSLYCHTQRIHPDIKGEDVATVMMKMSGDTTVVCEMAYAGNYLERERFPETFIFIEGSEGSIELAPDYWIRVTTKMARTRDAMRRHATNGPTRLTTSCTPASCLATADLAGRTARRSTKRKQPGKTT